MGFTQKEKKKMVNKWIKDEQGKYRVMIDGKFICQTNNFADALSAINEAATPGNESLTILNMEKSYLNILDSVDHV